MRTGLHAGPPAVPKILLTIEEAAEALSLGRTYMWRLVMQDQIRSVKVGRKRRIPLSALHEFVARRLEETEKGA